MGLRFDGVYCSNGHSSFRVPQDSGQKPGTHICVARSAMCLFIHLVEELSHHRHHGSHGDHPPPLPHPEAVPFSNLYRHRTRPVPFEHKVFQEPFDRRRQQRCRNCLIRVLSDLSFAVMILQPSGEKYVVNLPSFLVMDDHLFFL